MLETGAPHGQLVMSSHHSYSYAGPVSQFPMLSPSHDDGPVSRFPMLSPSHDDGPVSQFPMLSPSHDDGPVSVPHAVSES
jgi:hypothetical protein